MLVSPLKPFFTVREFLEGTELELTTLDRAVFLLVASFMDAETGENAYPGAERLAAVLGVKPDSISQSFRRLKAYRLVEPTVDHPHRGRAQSWQIGLLFKGALHKGAFGTDGKGGSTNGKARLGNTPTDITDLDRRLSNSEEASCQHIPIDTDGYCAACKTQVKEEARTA